MIVNMDVKLSDDDLYLPTYATNGSAGMDLRLTKSIALAPGCTVLVGTGVALQIKDPAIAGVVIPRSGLGHKQGLVLGNLVGLIDSDYNQEILLSVWNRSHIMQYLSRGDRVAQLVFMPIMLAQFNVVDEFESETDRGGFGSTGV